MWANFFACRTQLTLVYIIYGLDVPVVARRVAQGGFAQYKLSRARELIKQITKDVKTRTGSKLFDGHVQQMYLDNSLRGGIPVLLGDVDDKARSLSVDEDSRIKVYHLFSRIHGDLERDYNDFVIEPTFFSEGPGNFRDVAQNRRNGMFVFTGHIETRMRLLLTKYPFPAKKMSLSILALVHSMSSCF